jgi:hypothetical protein
VCGAMVDGSPAHECSAILLCDEVIIYIVRDLPNLERK